MVEEEARVVIGAGGMRSLVARSVGASEYNAKPTLTCAYHTYWSGVDIEGGRDLPTGTLDDHRLSYQRRPGLHLRRLATRGVPFGPYRHRRELSEEVRACTWTRRAHTRRQARGELVGTAVLPNFFRRHHGPGWALVGDARYHKDPYLPQGIMDAFRDAELLAEALDEGLAERRALDEALG